TMESVLPGPQVDALAALAATPIAERFYLAGGTALALQLGHRVSVDLDFFRADSFDPHAEIASLKSPGLTVTRTEEGTAHVVYRGVRVSLLGFPYPLLRPLVSSPPPIGDKIRL